MTFLVVWTMLVLGYDAIVRLSFELRLDACKF